MKRFLVMPAVTAVALSVLLTGCGSSGSPVPSPEAAVSAATPSPSSPVVTTSPSAVPMVPGAVLKAGAEFQAAQDAVMAAAQDSPCGPGEQRFVIGADANEQGAVAASACGFPDSEYGPSRITVRTADQTVVTVVEEADGFQQVNGTEFTRSDAGWTTDGYLGDSPAVAVISQDAAGAWSATVTVKAD